MNYLEIAKSCGARVNWRHLHKDGWRLNSAEVNSVNLTPDQLHAYTEQICKQMVEALTATIEGTLIDEVNRDEDSIYGVWNRLDSGLDSDYLHMHIKAIKKALAAHKEMMGDLYE